MAKKNSKAKSHKLLLALRESGAHSDLTIKCGSAEFQVHKCIVCPQSTFFEKVCKNKSWQEQHPIVIELRAAEGDCPDLAGDDPRAVKMMVDHFYLGDYDPKTSPAPDQVPPVENGVGGENVNEHSVELQTKPRDTDDEWLAPDDLPLPDLTRDGADASLLEMHAKVFAIALKYDISSLEQTARKKFKDHSKREWWIADLIAAIGIVFHRTPDHEIELRDALKDAMVRRAVYLIRHPDFKEAVEGVDGLAYELFCRMAASAKGSVGEPGPEPT